MVRVEVAQEDIVDLAQRNSQLIQSYCGAAACIENQVEAVGLDECRIAESLGARDGSARVRVRARAGMDHQQHGPAV